MGLRISELNPGSRISIRQQHQCASKLLFAVNGQPSQQHAFSTTVARQEITRKARRHNFRSQKHISLLPYSKTLLEKKSLLDTRKETMDSNKSPAKPPMQPSKSPPFSPSSLTPKKRMFGHCTDNEAITLSAARKKFSAGSVHPIRTTHEDGTKVNLWKVPLFEIADRAEPLTHETNAAVAAERQLREAAEERAAMIDKKIKGQAVFIGMAEPNVHNKDLRSTNASQKKDIDELTSKFEALMSEIEGLKSTVAKQQTTIENQSKEIKGLKSTVANQQTTIGNQSKEIEGLKSTVAEQQCEITLLTELSAL